MRSLLACVALFGAVATTSFAATQDFSYSGTFSGDADVVRFTFSIGSTSDVTLRSYSYAGGTMADGTVVSAGGFDPILSLWGANGVLIQEYDDGPNSVPSGPVTGSSFDTHLVLRGLAAGTYTAVVAQYNNFAVDHNNLSAGFQESSSTFTSKYGCSNGKFCDVGGNNRTSHWAFDVLGVESVVVVEPAPVPLPASALLLMGGLGALAGLRRKA